MPVSRLSYKAICCLPYMFFVLVIIAGGRHAWSVTLHLCGNVIVVSNKWNTYQLLRYNHKCNWKLILIILNPWNCCYDKISFNLDFQITTTYSTYQLVLSWRCSKIVSNYNLDIRSCATKVLAHQKVRDIHTDIIDKQLQRGTTDINAFKCDRTNFLQQLLTMTEHIIFNVCARISSTEYCWY